MARIVGNRIVPDEIITEQDTWRTNMNPQNAWGTYGINTLGQAPFTGLNQFPLAHAGAAGPEYLDMGVDLSGVNLDDTSGPHIRQKGEPFFNEGWNLGDAFDLSTTLGGYQKRPNIKGQGFNFPFTGIMGAIKDQFEYRPATETAWDPNTGEMVTAEEQDAMNALGGYYSDAARNARKQQARVINMIKRRDADKGYSKKNLQRLIDLGYGPKETITTTTVGDNINQGGGGYDRGYTQSQRAGVEAYHGRAGGKEMMSQGGRIGYRGGEFVDEDVNIQGPGFDFNENIEMASAQDPMDALNDMSLMIFKKPFDQLNDDEKQILFEMANDQAAIGQGEGIASLV
jgi:hypothetical protein